jgi:hypothetical protein
MSCARCLDKHVHFHRYFYVCSRDWTALFRAASVGGDSQMTATLSRSTKGLRRLLTDDGVPFELPLAATYLEAQRAAEAAKLQLAALQRDTALPTK